MTYTFTTFNLYGVYMLVRFFALICALLLTIGSAMQQSVYDKNTLPQKHHISK
ncbi:hypothetical protein [Hydrogenimonas cancrithermarum]|nr:hypothetical protein [Hydrogenimonas cancrithermarum]